MIETVFWTAEARADLRELALYLAQYDPAVARRAALRFFTKANQLVHFPDMGRIGAEPNTRELSVPRWKRVIVYRIRNGRLEVLALRDTRRQSTDT